MPEMTSPQGEVLTIPDRGVQSMKALGWTVNDKPERSKADDDKPAAKKTTRRKPR